MPPQKRRQKASPEPDDSSPARNPWPDDIGVWHAALGDVRLVAFVSAYVKGGGDLEDAATRCRVDIEEARGWYGREEVQAAINARMHEVGLGGAIADIVAKQILLDPNAADRDKTAIIAAVKRSEDSRDVVNALRDLGRPAELCSADELYALAEVHGHVMVSKTEARQIAEMRRQRLSIGAEDADYSESASESS